MKKKSIYECSKCYKEFTNLNKFKKHEKNCKGKRWEDMTKNERAKWDKGFEKGLIIGAIGQALFSGND